MTPKLLQRLRARAVAVTAPASPPAPSASPAQRTWPAGAPLQPGH